MTKRAGLSPGSRLQKTTAPAILEPSKTDESEGAMGYNDDWEKLMNSVFGPQGRVHTGGTAEKAAQPPKPAARPSGKAAASRPARPGGMPDLHKALQEQLKTPGALL